MELQGKKPNRKKTENPKTFRNNTWEHMLFIAGSKIKICRPALCKLFQVSVRRLRVIQKKVLHNETFEERRGSHDNRPHKLESYVWVKLEGHLSMIPSEKSHYYGSKTNLNYFQNPNLNVKTLFEMFSKNFFEQTGKKLTMKYVTYFKFLKEHSNYAFKQPKTDICDFCSQCQNTLRSDPTDVCKVEYALHQRKAERYLSMKGDFILKTKTDPSYLVVEFDYSQNLPVLKLNVTSQFYKRLLWLYAFNVHIQNDSSSFMYCFMEMEAKKDSNSVASFLNHALRKKLSEFHNVKKVILLSDAYGGQNKNLVTTSFCSWLARVCQVEVTHLFPVRGHSFGHCDRNFGLMKSKLKKVETIPTALPYLSAMVECRTYPSPFEVCMDRTLIKDWRSGLNEYCLLPKSIAKGSVFKIQSYTQLKYTTNGTILCSPTYFSTFTPFRLWKQKYSTQQLKDIELSTVIKHQ
ncbi:hypothetical protein ANN_13771 [Periplaneta americana]|uniref:DUF7869 domain-containing protein n=1 Tax=Periplaneta americana TaxID=6978 RepID=A0ABQ8SUG1_PERAM|nr:hypothetical protein ANN_13771 [Periplaneta americana]